MGGIVARMYNARGNFAHSHNLERKQMKAKLGHILNATLYFEAMQNPMIDTPLKRLVNMQLPASQCHRLTQITHSIEKHLKEFEDTRQALIKKHGKETDGNWIVPEENNAAFGADLTEVANSEVEIPGEQIRVEVMAHAPMTTADMIALSFLFAGFENEEAPKRPALSVVKKKGNGKEKVASA